MNRRKFIAGAGGLITGSVLAGCFGEETDASNWEVHDSGEYSDYHSHDHVYVDVEYTGPGTGYANYSMKVYSEDGFFITETARDFGKEISDRERLVQRVNTDAPSDCHVSLVIHNTEDLDHIELNHP